MRRNLGLGGLLIGLLLLRKARRGKPTPQNLPDTVAEPLGYDLRKGAAAYAPIIGAISGFVVPAVILTFEIASSAKGAPYGAQLGRASSLLTLGLIACLLSSFTLAAIGAERRLTPNLTAATLYAGAATVIGVVAIIAAFEALSVAFLPATRDLFVWITTGTAIGGTVLVSLVLGDAWTSAPPRHWLSERSVAYRWAIAVAGVSSAALFAGGLLYFFGVRIVINEHQLHWIIGIGILLALLGGLGSTFRTMHGSDADRGAISKPEALGTIGILVTYLLILLLALS